MNAISEVRFIPVSKQGSLVGFITFLYKDDFELRDMAVHSRRSGGYRIVYPKNKTSNTTIFRPITKEFQEEIDNEVTLFMEGLNVHKG